MRTRLDVLPRIGLVSCLCLALFQSGCVDEDLGTQASWTQQDDEGVSGEGFGEALYTLQNCPAGQEWDASMSRCRTMWDAPCYQTRGIGWGGMEPWCTKFGSPPSPPEWEAEPGTPQSCASTRGPTWCGIEPSCAPCPVACSQGRGTGWCGTEPNCYACPACSETRNSDWWCGNEPNCEACGPYCSTTRGPNSCGREPSCYSCGNGGGTSEGG